MGVNPQISMEINQYDVNGEFIKRFTYSHLNFENERILIEFTNGKIVEYWTFDGNLSKYFNFLVERFMNEKELKKYFYDVIFKELKYKIIKQAN